MQKYRDCLDDKILTIKFDIERRSTMKNIQQIRTVSKLRNFLKNEDYLAIIIGFTIITIASVSIITSSFDFSALKFATWGRDKDFIEIWSSTVFVKLIRTFLVLAIFFTAGAYFKGYDIRKYLKAFIGLFVLSVIVRIISAEYTLNRYLEWAFFALAVGLIIANTIGAPNWLKPAIQTEYYIKTGLIIMGFSVLFSNIVNFGLYGLGIAWIVTPLVMLFMYYFAKKVLKMDNEPLIITMAAATSVCGTSAAIATGAASRAEKDDLFMTVSISIIFTVLMMVFMPVIIKTIGMDELIGGALIGGTIDSTGAVTVAGSTLGKLGETSAILVKSIQNILIGFIAVAVAVFFASKEKKKKGEGVNNKVKIGEIWYRLPKFILGFFIASLIASFIVQNLVGYQTLASINTTLDQYKNWIFVLAFTSIGLETNFKELIEKFEGGKPLILYIVGQLVNVLFTFIAAWVLLSGIIFEIPTLKI